MNEQIQSLLEQAGLYTRLDNGNLYPVNLTAEEAGSTYEKFAELLIQECVSICDAYGMPDGTSPTAMILSLAIKNHFGL